VNNKDSRILRRCKRKIEKRLERREWADQPRPMLSARSIRYEMSDRTRAMDCGAIGAIHLLAQKTGLVQRLDSRLRLLKRHLPYHESDHVLTVAYNTMCGGTCLDDIELRRSNETYLDALDAQRIPDPTTAGDFARRFEESDVAALMEAVNDTRVEMWRKKLAWQERDEAILDVDGTLAPTTGEQKEGMGLSYNGVWGYHPLLVSLANTREPLYTVNRPGNRPSHDGAAPWMNKAVALVRRGGFERVTFRGDTDFSLTENFDGWTKDGVRFAFGMDAMRNLVQIAESLDATVWKTLERKVREAQEGAGRARRENVKERIVAQNEYKNLRLKGEAVAEVAYRPTKCERDYRLIILRKNLSVEKGENVLFDDIRYFFYITNIGGQEMPADAVVFFCNERCDQENLIEQLKNGLNALRMPVGDLVSNWAYMVMASLAWTLKAWFALVTRGKERREKLIKMEFKRFLNGVVRIPAQIIKTGRRIVYRLLGYGEWTGTLLRTFDAIRVLRLT
jgi:hypothetical protein